MNTHTHGPWTLIGDEVYGADGTRIAEAVKTQDALLIAAAPDLLEALQHVMRCIPLGGFAQIHHGSSTLRQIDAAVSKALGLTVE